MSILNIVKMDTLYLEKGQKKFYLKILVSIKEIKNRK